MSTDNGAVLSAAQKLAAIWSARAYDAAKKVTNDKKYVVDKKCVADKKYVASKRGLMSKPGIGAAPNRKLSSAYMAEKRALGSGVEECYAFHGTAIANVRSILSGGFEMSRGGSLGPGVYLTISHERAASYAGAGGRILLVKALVQVDERRKLDICIRTPARALPIGVLNSAKRTTKHTPQ
jgi:hypothetical protein